MTGGVIVWFRQDLRLKDNPALHAAVESGQPVIPVYIWSPEEEGEWAPGAASRWWLQQSLEALGKDLKSHGSRLILARGRALPVLKKLAAASGAAAVHWNKRYEPAAVECSRQVLEGLKNASLGAVEFNGSLLADPTRFLNKAGKPYQVFTAFKRGLLHVLDPGPLAPTPRKLHTPRSWPKSASLKSLALLPTIQWYKTMAASWNPGERGAEQSLKSFLRTPIEDYSTSRNLPAAKGTSRLSPHLHFGEISPRPIAS